MKAFGHHHQYSLQVLNIYSESASVKTSLFQRKEFVKALCEAERNGSHILVYSVESVAGTSSTEDVNLLKRQAKSNCDLISIALIAERKLLGLPFRLRGLLKLHTKTTRQDNLTKNVSLSIDREAAEGALQVADTLRGSPELINKVLKVHIRTLGMDIAMFDEDVQRDKLGL